MDSHLKYWYWLGALTGVSSKRVKHLLEIYGNAYEIYRRSYDELAKLEFLNPRIAAMIADPSIRVGLDDRLYALTGNGVEVISIQDDRYPCLLREIDDPPTVLYMRGDAPLKRDDMTIAVVGTRRPTAYGIAMTKKLVQGLAAFDFTIVSGLAAGIDAEAHDMAIEEGVKTIAFLGCGVERAYPATNSRLMREVIKNGAVYSEYPPGTVPYQSNFPQRNRLISGASLGTVVVEAGERSGALITAGFAGDQGRDVFAVPGNATSPLSRGANALLRDGAQVAASVDDIVFALNKYMGAQGFSSINMGEGNLARIELERKLQCLGAEELRVANAIRERGPQNINAIAEICSISAGEASALAVMLEIKGLFRRMDDGAYVFDD